MIKIVYDVMPYAIMLTIPIFITSLGGLVSERSGVVNIALEGMMIIGGFISTIFVYYFAAKIGNNFSVIVGIILAGIVTGIFALIHGYASITLNADQVISATALNIAAPSITIFLARRMTGTQNVNLMQGIPRYNVPFLSEVPVIGPIFFTNFYPSSLVILIIGFYIWYLVFKTKFGIHLRACGENPHSADSNGINVYKVRYIAVFISGALAGIGGAVFVLTVSKEFSGSVGGLGFLSLGALIFGKWKVLNVLGATFFFGFMKTLGNVASVNPVLKSLALPMELYSVLPYAMTILALVLFSKNTLGPKAVGQPYDKGKR